MINERKDTDVLQKSFRQLNDRIFSIEKLLNKSHAVLERDHSTISQKDKPLSENVKFVHVFSRESPYIFTNQARFPVTEKFILWTVNWDNL